MKHIAILIFILMNVAGAKGQTEDIAQLDLKTFVMNDGVALRWTPPDIYHFRQWSKKGYRLERYTIGKDGKALDHGPAVLIGGESLQPLGDQEWKMLRDSFAAAGLVQQCMQEDERKSPSGKTYLQQQEEQEQCYVFSMLAMQNNFRLAVAAGLGFMDRSVQAGEVYLYRLSPGDSSSLARVEVVVDMEQLTQLSVLPPLRLSTKDQRVLIQWDAETYRKDYFGFQLERSLDSGGSYQVLNAIPLVPVRTDDIQQVLETFTDTVVGYGLPVLYRIRGIGYFGQPGLPSEPAEIRVQYETERFPSFVEVKGSGAGGAEIQWQFDGSEEKYIRGFMVLQAAAIDGPFEPVDSNFLPGASRRASLKTSALVTYVQVAAITLSGKQNPSLPLMVQQEDSMPPAAPVCLSAQIDTNGIATLRWRNNAEQDLLGYKLFRANFRSSEFEVITPIYLQDTFYSDTLFTGMIRDSIYYCLMAFDLRYNESAFSSIQALALPDRIPPSAPYVDELTVKDQRVSVHWVESNSNDVKRYHLIREDESTGNRQIFYTEAGTNMFTDSLVTPGASYRYSLLAEDRAGLKSIMAQPRLVHVPSMKIMPKVQISQVMQDTAKNCIHFFWDYAYDAEVSHYRIMQKVSGGTMQTIGTALPGKTFFSSFYLRPYVMSEYIIIAYFKDGRRSKL